MLDNQILKMFGENIREIRLAKQISQEKLGQLTGLHRTYIGCIERGERNLSLKNIVKISRALNEKPDAFFRGIE